MTLQQKPARLCCAEGNQASRPLADPARQEGIGRGSPVRSTRLYAMLASQDIKPSELMIVPQAATMDAVHRRRIPGGNSDALITNSSPCRSKA